MLSQIFLRLIRTIIAPLLFATLVVGIAGHSNLRQVGRMGVKSLVYFEVITTFALVIGWVAITLSQAGVGILIVTLMATSKGVAGVPRGAVVILLGTVVIARWEGEFDERAALSTPATASGTAD